ncbi:MAG: plasmid stabilization protein [Candidatus Riflebacteria bacterium HGW-Riflebacteria-2]|jgi:addiction module RelE/StbE family toxin|nr:MAG: plasmid stabilization protein [Candidatus Riflebacteria bacterium HGW-Riflebacteria-2]
MKKRFKISWSEQAVLDLERLISYIANENPKTARLILSKIKIEVSQLDYLPFRGRIVPEFEEQGFLLYRELVIKPWRIVYRVSRERVFILAVFDSRKNVDDVLLERFIKNEKFIV